MVNINYLNKDPTTKMKAKTLKQLKALRDSEFIDKLYHLNPCELLVSRLANEIYSPVAIKDAPEIDYIWVFISFYVSRGIGGPKKPKLPFSFFNDVLKMWHQLRH